LCWTVRNALSSTIVVSRSRQTAKSALTLRSRAAAFDVEY